MVLERAEATLQAYPPSTHDTPVQRERRRARLRARAEEEVLRHFHDPNPNPNPNPNSHPNTNSNPNPNSNPSPNPSPNPNPNPNPNQVLRHFHDRARVALPYLRLRAQGLTSLRQMRRRRLGVGALVPPFVSEALCGVATLAAALSCRHAAVIALQAATPR